MSCYFNARLLEARQNGLDCTLWISHSQGNGTTPPGNILGSQADAFGFLDIWGQVVEIKMWMSSAILCKKLCISENNFSLLFLPWKLPFNKGVQW